LVPVWPGESVSVHAAWVWNRALLRERLVVSAAAPVGVSDLEFVGRLAEHVASCDACLVVAGPGGRRPVDELVWGLRRVRRLRPVVSAALAQAS
jgi:hypothetical protein